MQPHAPRLNRCRSAALTLLVAACVVSTAQATQVRPVNLEEMTARAATIFQGRCIELREEKDPQLGRPVTIATFEVDRSVKGRAGQRVTIKTLGGIEKSSAPVGAPRFSRGERVVLFLYEESALGLTSPVGLGQGKFAVQEDKLGRRLAVNEVGNRNLLDGISAAAKQRLGGDLQNASSDAGLTPDRLLDLAAKLIN